MRGIQYLIPEAQEAATELVAVCADAGLSIKLTDSFRTKDEQDALYAQGRTTPGEIVTSCRYPDSLHNWGCAFDFCRNVKGCEYDDSDGFFESVGAIAQGLGLVWGGSFKKPDRPHVQLALYAPDRTAALLKTSYADPLIFIAEKRSDARAGEILLKGMAQLAKLAPNEPWKAEALAWAQERGILKGDGNGNLMGEKPLLRVEFAQALKNMEEDKK